MSSSGDGFVMNACEHLKEWFSDPDVPISRDPVSGTYSLSVSPTILLSRMYCILCGDPINSGALCQCGYLGRVAIAGNSLVEYSSALNEYHLLRYSREGFFFIHYCPSCGCKLPSSRRADLFLAVSPQETQQLSDRLRGCNTLQNVIMILGKPDGDYTPSSVGAAAASIDATHRVLRYSRLAATLDLYVHESRGGQITLDYVPKGRSNPEVQRS